jgi:hypothetical protein
MAELRKIGLSFGGYSKPASSLSFRRLDLPI